MAATDAAFEELGNEANLDARSGNAKLTLEEMKVLQKCKYNSIVFRGLPIGVSCAAIVHSLKKGGYIKSGVSAVLVGLVGFTLGQQSYYTFGACRQNMMSLPNSPLANRLREYEKNKGIPVIPSLISNEENKGPFFPDEKNTGIPVLDENRSIQSNQTHSTSTSKESSKWEEIRSKSRQDQSSSPSDGSRWEEIRRQSRSGQGVYNSLEPEEEEALERKARLRLSPELASLRSQQFSENQPSALDFSKSDDVNLIADKDNVEAKIKYRKNIKQRNQYGDDVE